jgi:hypothetical protein
VPAAYADLVDADEDADDDYRVPHDDAYENLRKSG